MLTARFHNLSSKALRNLDCLGNAASFCYKSRNIWTGPEIASFFERLNSNPNCHFFHFCDVFLPPHASSLPFIVSQPAEGTICVCPPPPKLPFDYSYH